MGGEKECERPYRHSGSTRSRSKKSWSLFTEEISIGNWESVRESQRVTDRRQQFSLSVNEVCDLWHSCCGYYKHLSSVAELYSFPEPKIA